MTAHVLQQIIEKSRALADGHDTLSMGEKIAAALTLNRPDILEELGYTLGEAIDRLGPTWLAQIPAAARQLASERGAVEQVLATARRRTSNDALLSTRADDEELCFNAELLTYGSAPGYRNADLIFSMVPMIAGDERKPARVRIQIRPQDAEEIVQHLKAVHALAWRKGEPLDYVQGETRPSWIDLATKESNAE